MGDHRLSKRVMFGMLERTAKRRRCGKEKELTDFVKSKVRAFGIPGD